MDWKKFSYQFELNQVDVWNELIQIEGYKEAAVNLVLPPEWSSQLDRLNRIRAVYGTTALEGNPLSEAEVSSQMDLLTQPLKSSTPRATKEQLQIRNAGLAQVWVKMRFGGPESAPLRVSDILHVHKLITDESDEKNNLPGAFRKFSVVVGAEEIGGVHRGAPAENIDTLIQQFVDFVNSRKVRALHPVVRALLSHFFLITIHPFGDGNGRVSRLIEAGILFEGGYNVLGFYGLSNYFYRNEAEYKTTLQRSRDKQPFDVTGFVSFGLRGYATELKGINNFIKTKLNRLVYRAMLVRAFNRKESDRRRVLNQREYSLLDFLLTTTEPRDPFSESPSRQVQFEELNSSAYVRAAYKSVTSRTFWRELMRLQSLGFIKFSKPSENEKPTVEIDFNAIEKY